ncbi:unnamed protein product [Owenia fusiformis]|uniref:Alpha-taxilin n=1 Tax=Owenia fusiformis TaxID=6347 RepID=A0A8J1XHV4_OWEFU|nr:unnamed protein product [Owenia fusiformis]CAH1798772.1 unnamed protein product [Owenia fusiformis]
MAATMSAKVEQEFNEEKVGVEGVEEENVQIEEPCESGKINAQPAPEQQDGSTEAASTSPPDVSTEESSREPSPSADLQLALQELEAVSPKKVQKDSTRKKKEDKTIEHILKALNSLSSPEEKLAALCKKYTDLLEDHRVTQSTLKQNQRKLTVLGREKEQLQSEHSKAVLAKSKLESLCRELQRHNKLVKEESLARAREEEEKRKEVTAKFQTTITDIQSQMNDHHSKNSKLREENIDLASKLKNLIEQYDLREQHIEKVIKHKDLESQLVEAKLQQSTLHLTEEKQKNTVEKEILLAEQNEAKNKIALLEAQEKQLRTQVALYTEKYEEFQTTLSKSNEVFASFKTEMEKMTKKIRKLEKETHMWRNRWESSNTALINMAEEKTRSDKEIATLNTKIRRLESLCRALQAERNKNEPLVNGSQVEEDSVNTNPTDGDTEANINTLGRDIQPTKTPPNTPNSRASPVTTQNGDPPDSQSENPDHQIDQSGSSESTGVSENNQSEEVKTGVGVIVNGPSDSESNSVSPSEKQPDQSETSLQPASDQSESVIEDSGVQVD